MNRTLVRQLNSVPWAAGAILAGSLVFISGCQHKDLADRESEIRLQRLAYVPRVYAAHEQTRPLRLERMGRHIDWYFRHQAVHFERNTRDAGAYFARDVERAQDRLPRYGEKAGDIFWGRPERIEKTAIRLFW